MNQKDASRAYLTATIENAPPIQIVRLLYQGALRFLGQAMAVEGGPTDPKFRPLIRRVEDIVVELRLALDQEAAGDDEVPQNLERLYLYCEDELFRAQLDQSLEPLENVKQVLMVLLDAWKQVELQSGDAA